ncbi:MAG: type II secretion system protein GspF [Planctomycetota bacterium]|nr:MAG: type II secretion system protein GspF [Planctomycetota bacterium]
MPVFEYEALTEKGAVTRGTVDADTAREARAKLRAQRVHVTRMQQVGRKAAAAGAGAGSLQLRLPKLRRVRGAADVPLATRQLATLLRAGIPLAEAVNALVQQVESPDLERVLRQIKEDITSGSRTADAFARHPEYFGPLYVAMVRAGEASGNLDTILHRLADFLQKQSKMKGKVSAALVYPIALAVVGVGVVAFLMRVVVPKLIATVEERGLELPLPTAVLKVTSDFLGTWWWALVLVALLALALYQAWVRTEAGRLKRDTLLLRLPIFGELFRKQAVARFATTFATLLRSGIPAHECLRILREVVDNALLARTIDQVHDRILEGTDIATPLRNSGVFPPVVSYMIAVGEQSGQLEAILGRVAEAYDEEIEQTIQKVTSLIEPVIIVSMALVVGFIVLSVLLPMVQSMSSIS